MSRVSLLIHQIVAVPVPTLGGAMTSMRVTPHPGIQLKVGFVPVPTLTEIGPSHATRGAVGLSPQASTADTETSNSHLVAREADRCKERWFIDVEAMDSSTASCLTTGRLTVPPYFTRVNSMCARAREPLSRFMFPPPSARWSRESRAPMHYGCELPLVPDRAPGRRRAETTRLVVNQVD